MTTKTAIEARDATETAIETVTAMIDEARGTAGVVQTVAGRRSGAVAAIDDRRDRPAAVEEATDPVHPVAAAEAVPLAVVAAPRADADADAPDRRVTARVRRATPLGIGTETWMGE